MPPPSKLTQRLLFGTIMTLALTALLILDAYLGTRNYFFTRPNMAGLGFTILVAIFAAAAAVELRNLARTKGWSPPLLLMMITAALVAAHPLWSTWLNLPATSLAAIFFAALLLAALSQARKKTNQHALANFACLCFATIYLGLGCWFLVSIRLLGAPADDVIGQLAPAAMFLATVKSTDIGAYLIGRKIGRHPWVPAISPAKTYEGLIAGMIVAAIVASLLGAIFDIMTIGRSFCFGLAVALIGQLGDLLESMLKRDSGSKDSAQLVPQFGGILDLLDSPLVAAPFGYALLVWLGRS